MSKTSQPDTADETRTDAAGEDVQLDASQIGRASCRERVSSPV